MKNDFLNKAIIIFLDFQIFLLIFILIYVFGRVFITYDFFRAYETEIRLISYFLYFIYFDFRQKKTFAMKMHKYEFTVQKDIDLLTIIKYEILRFFDTCLFPIYMILSIISDKKDRLLLTERFTIIKMEKT